MEATSNSAGLVCVHAAIARDALRHSLTICFIAGLYARDGQKVHASVIRTNPTEGVRGPGRGYQRIGRGAPLCAPNGPEHNSRNAVSQERGAYVNGKGCCTKPLTRQGGFRRAAPR